VTRCCLVVTTYERPDALARVLKAFLQPEEKPDAPALSASGMRAARAGRPELGKI